jgi:predicted Zn-dependent peptidase
MSSKVKKGISKTKKINYNINLVKHNNLNFYQNKDGVKLIIMPNKSDSSTASIYFYFKVGSKNEELDYLGISHLVEHMVFKGSDNYNTYLEISRPLDAAGINFNAFTNKEVTGYNFKFLSTIENINLILKIAKDMCLNPLMRIKDFELEKKVVIQELKDDKDDIDEFIEDETEKILFNDHPLSRTIIGTMKTLNNIKLLNLKNYYKKYYNLDNLLIGISGNIHQKFYNIINTHFKPFTKYDLKTLGTNPVSLYPYIETQNYHIIKCIPKSLEQNHVKIIFKTNGFFDIANNNIYRLISNILGGNMSSRLFVELREKLGLVYNIKCKIVNYEEIGYFVIYLQCDHKNTLKCLDKILFELNKFVENNITLNELNSFKTNYINQFISSFDDIENENEYYSEQILFNRKIETIKDKINFIQNISIIDIANASRYLFNLNKVTIIIFGKSNSNNIETIINKYKKKTLSK